MTAGQLLISLSGLSGISAAAHLQAVTGGSGTTKTIFASRMSVITNETRISARWRAPREALEEKTRNVSPASEAVGKNVRTHTSWERIRAHTEDDEIVVTQRREAHAVKQSLKTAVSFKKHQ